MRLARLVFSSALALLSGTLAVAGPWTPELAFKVKRVSRGARSRRTARAWPTSSAPSQMEGEKSEWLSHVHVAGADGSDAFAAHARRQVVDDARLVAGRQVARLPLRPRPKKDQGPKANLWRIRADGGEAEALTDEKGAGSPRSSGRRTASTIAFLMTDPKTEDEEKADKEKRDARVVDGKRPKLTRLYVVPVEKDADGKRPVRKLTEGAMSLGNLAVASVLSFDWSPDGRQIAFTHQPTPDVDDWPKQDVSVVEVESGPCARWPRPRRRGVRTRLLAGRAEVAYRRRATTRPPGAAPPRVDGRARAGGTPRRWPRRPTSSRSCRAGRGTAARARRGDARHASTASGALPVDGGARVEL